MESPKPAVDIRAFLRRLILPAIMTMMGVTTTVADENPYDRWAAYEYTADEVNAATREDLDRTLAPLRDAGKINRNTPAFARAREVFARVVDAAMRRSDLARNLDWTLYLHAGRFIEAYSRSGGQVVVSENFLERFQPDDAELALVIGHEVAHVLCEHERMKLSAVWRRNAPQKLQVRYAMEYLDTEPWVRDQIAPLVRLQERIADRVGLELVAASGIDPVSVLAFFDKSADDNRDSIFPNMHDRPDERESMLRQRAKSIRMTAALARNTDVDCRP